MKKIRAMIAAVAVAAAAAFGVVAADPPVAAASHQYNDGRHWYRDGNNPQFGKYVYFKDYTVQGLQTWDAGIAPSGGTYDFQNKWNQQLVSPETGSPGYYHLLLLNGTGNNTVPTDIPIYETYRTDSWCSGPAQGCAAFYLYGDGHIAYVDVTLNDALYYQPGGRLTPFKKKVVLCHEVGHALGLDHTGENGEPARNGCMDVGTYHFASNVPTSHDGQSLNEVYGSYTHGFKLTWPYGPIGTPPDRGSNPKFVSLGRTTDKTHEFLQESLKRAPKHIQKLVAEGKAYLGGLHRMEPITE